MEDRDSSRKQDDMDTVTTPMDEWNRLPWKSMQRQVFRLQKRIYQASQRGDVKAVHKLQRLLMQSWSARCLAVRKVTQDNRGKKTAGVDGVKSLKPPERLLMARQVRLPQKARPTRRVWIPKPGTQDQRGLGIPTMQERAAQALAKLALEPEWEARFEPNSYGFRPGRSCHDAIRAIFDAIKSKPKYVLDADIAKCFDRINHDALRKRAPDLSHAQTGHPCLAAGGGHGRGNAVPHDRGDTAGWGDLTPAGQHRPARLRKRHPRCLSRAETRDEHPLETNRGQVRRRFRGHARG